MSFFFMSVFFLSQGQVSVEIGGSYALPRFDSFFRYEFESKVGLHAGIRMQREDKIVLGIEGNRIRFQPYSISFNGLDRADYTGLSVSVAYPLTHWESGAIEASIGGGYGRFSYNNDEQKSQALQLDLGTRFLWYPEDSYAIVLKISRLQYFDRFGPKWNPYESNNLRMILFSAGFNFRL